MVAPCVATFFELSTNYCVSQNTTLTLAVIFRMLIRIIGHLLEFTATVKPLEVIVVYKDYKIDS